MEGGDGTDPLDFLAIFRSASNRAGYHNPSYDKLIDQADPGRRTNLLEQAEHPLLNDTPLIPIDNPVTRTLVSARVTGWLDNYIGLQPSRYLGIK